MIINLDRNSEESTKYAAYEASKIINNGGIVVSPTDTVYGMLADASNKEAVERIYQIKEREKNKPFLILIKNAESSKYFSQMEIPDIVKKIRVPKDKYMQLILNNTKPLVAPSANPSGAGEILDGNKLAELYKDKANLIINAGILENKMPSTLYDCLENKILRQGSVILNI